MPKILTIKEVAKHNKKDDCWVIIHDKVYDLSEFIPDHPGGQKIIIRYAGKDATKKYDPIHAPGILEKYLPASKCLGPVVSNIEIKQEEEEIDKEEEQRLERIKNKPPLSSIYNLYDFEYVARRVLPRSAWYYYSSGADDEITMRENHQAYQKIWFKPKVLVDVSEIDLSCEMLGFKSQAPFYVSAAALGKLGHPDGEKNLTIASGKHGVIQMISTLASCSFNEIVDAAIPGQGQWFQLYVNSDRKLAHELIVNAEKRGMKGLWVTVDAPSLGNRTKDFKCKFEEELANVQGEEELSEPENGAAKALSSFIDTAVTWKDIDDFKTLTKVPIGIKGIQRGEDAVLAVEHGVQAIVVSNHGGRQLEYSRPSIEVLIEVMSHLRKHGYENKIEVYVDGGIRRGTDILKAMCLGAKGVGLGKSFLYAMSSYGEPGVNKAMQLLKDELTMNMRLLGVTKISDLNPTYLDIRGITTRSVPEDKLFNNVYEPITTTEFRNSKL